MEFLCSVGVAEEKHRVAEQRENGDIVQEEILVFREGRGAVGDISGSVLEYYRGEGLGDCIVFPTLLFSRAETFEPQNSESKKNRPSI